MINNQFLAILMTTTVLASINVENTYQDIFGGHRDDSLGSGGFTAQSLHACKSRNNIYTYNTCFHQHIQIESSVLF